MVSFPPERSLTRFAKAATAMPYGWVGVVTYPSRSTLPLSDELELDELPHAPSAVAMAASATIAVSLPRCPLNASPLRDRSGSAPRPVSAVAATERLPQGARNLRTGAAGCQHPHEPVAEGETPLPKRDHEVVADPARGPPRPLTPHRS